jgi:hypothetical protein
MTPVTGSTPASAAGRRWQPRRWQRASTRPRRGPAANCSSGEEPPPLSRLARGWPTARPTTRRTTPGGRCRRHRSAPAARYRCGRETSCSSGAPRSAGPTFPPTAPPTTRPATPGDPSPTHRSS